MTAVTFTSSVAQQAAIAAHRFGLGEPNLQGPASDPAGWLIAQIGAAEPQRGTDLVSGAQGIKRFFEFTEQRRLMAARNVKESAQVASPSGVAPGIVQGMVQAGVLPSSEQQFGLHFRSIVQNDTRARLATATLSSRPFNERLALFWANHFTVSMAKASTRGVVGAFEREAIRPHIGGSFEALLKASTHHLAMLRYLDNDQSAGPNSAIVQRLARRKREASEASEPAPRLTGLNENLAREVLELHTLGVAGGGAAYGGWGGYSQADVTEFARVLTGWRVPVRDIARDAAAHPGARFDATWHDPGSKTVLSKRYAEGPQALDAVLNDLAVHPSTARFVCSKLARHFVADDPPLSLVARLEANFRHTGGDLPSLYRVLVQAPEAWSPQPAKLKTPEEFVISSVRVLQLGEEAFARASDAGIGQLGQRVHSAPSPAGWPDRAEEWLGPDAVWKRVEWATRVAARAGRQIDARALASASLGALLNDSTALQIQRAADGPQALALLLLAPEFQRR